MIPPGTLTKGQVAEKLGVSTRTIDRLRALDQFPAPVANPVRKTPIVWDEAVIEALKVSGTF